MIDQLDVQFDADHHALEEEVSRFARDTVEGLERSGGEEDALARAFISELAKANLLRHAVPSSNDRDRLDSRSLCIIRENLARASGFCDVMFAMQGLGSAPVTLAGSAELKSEVLPKVASGDSICAFALTEPEAGSDVASISTSAEKDGSSYRLNGTKTFISNAGVADLYTVFAKTDPAGGNRGITAFMVEADNPGLKVTERQKVIAPHPIGTISFKDCIVPDTHRLGNDGEGFKIAMRTLDVFRPTVGAAAIGLARRALAESLDRARSRVQFGNTIGSFQAIQMHLGKMATEVDAARLLVYRAASLADAGAESVTRPSAMAKLYATEAAQRVVDAAVQIHGGEGVLHGSVVERLYREVRALRIYEGTTEIQHIVIASRLLKEDDAGY